MMASMGHAEELGSRTRFAGHGGAPPRNDLDDALSSARDGDEDAFRALYRDLNPRLLRYVRVLVGDEAEDVTSEAWLRIARDFESFDGDVEAFRAWGATIARHRAFDHMRYRRRHRSTPVGELPEPPASDDTEMRALEAVSTEAALAVLRRLPREQAEIILLRVVVGLDAKTVAGVLGKRVGAVRMAAHRGLRRLERDLGGRSRPHE